ncbi:MAG: ECF-type sigma factor [Fuerstiella sp.]
MNEDLSNFLQRVKQGRDDEASEALWNAYFQRMVSVARRNLHSLPKREADEEDIAISAMHSFFTAAQAGRLDGLQDRDELWKILVTMVIRKTHRHREKATARKRGAGNMRGESVFLDTGRDGDRLGLAGIPDELLVTSLKMELEHLFSHLDDDVLKEIALRRMEGYTVDEIAGRLDIARSTVKRKLVRIKSQWEATEDLNND